MHLVHTGRAPSYLCDCFTASVYVSSRSRLRSVDSRHYELPHMLDLKPGTVVLRQSVNKLSLRHLCAS